MGFLWRLAAFAIAMALGVLAAYLAAHKPAAGALLQFTAANIQDLMFWLFGLALVGAPALRFVRGGFGAGPHWLLSLCLGAVLIYTELFNVAPFKEAACRILLTGHHANHGPGPCYKGGV